MKRLILIVTAISLLLPLAAAGQQNQNQYQYRNPNQNQNGDQKSNRCSLTGLLRDLPYEDLNERQIADLVFIREEEKLARDVYLSMYEEWGLRTFRQIARAEKTHMRAVLYHLNKYEIPDPAAGNGVGVFTNPDLQELYDDLVLMGMLSVGDALEVGAFIEELDIRDLRRALVSSDVVTANLDLQMLYQNLLKGSRNHLRTFHKKLTRLGIVYDPQFLTQEEYDEIVYSPKEKGVVDASGEYLCGGEGKRLGAG
jgi:hypothetical protein